MALQETVWLGDIPLIVLKGTSRYYVESDHLNTPRRISNDANASVWTWDVITFGGSVPNDDPRGTGSHFTYNLRFPGQYYDAESGLFQNGFREYSPKLGRYVESDPIGSAGGLNTYGYVGGNPVGLRDRTGLIVDTIWDLGNLGYDLWNQNWGDALADFGAMCVPGLPAGITKLGKGQDILNITGRSNNKLSPIEGAEGVHSALKVRSDGKLSNYSTYETNVNNPSGLQEVKRVDLTGRSHRNPDGAVIPTPHVKEAGSKGVRPANQDELP